jgi:probable addiction module antidote protein
VELTVGNSSRYDVVEHLRTQEDIAAYLDACVEAAGDDVVFIAKALDDIARAKVILETTEK